MKRTKILQTLIAGTIIGGAVFSGAAAYAATTLTIPDNYAEILKPSAIKWSDTDSTGYKSGAVVEKAIDGIGTLVCYFVPDDYWLLREAVITRDSDKGTYYFIVGYAPGAPAEYKRGMAAILCSPDEAPADQSPAIFVEDLRAKFGATATATPTATPAPCPAHFVARNCTSGYVY